MRRSDRTGVALESVVSGGQDAMPFLLVSSATASPEVTVVKGKGRVQVPGSYTSNEQVACVPCHHCLQC